MRKLLILCAAMLVSAGIMAQSTATKHVVGVSNKYQKVQKVNQNGSSTSHEVNAIQRPAQNNFKATEAISKTLIGSSKNVYTALVSESTCLTANEETGLIAFTHRVISSSASSSGFIQTSFSSDGGFAWDSTTVIPWQNFGGYSGRYPSGVIYNPTGNTTPANAYAVVTGPMIESSWAGGFYASEQFDGTGINQQYTYNVNDTAVGGFGYVDNMPRNFLQTRGDKFFVVGEANTDDGTNYTGFTTIINKGLWNSTGDSVDWSRSVNIPAYLTDGAGNPDGYAIPGLVFDNAGVNGYLVYIGRDGDATDNLTFQPMIYKSTNGGSSWTKQAAFNWATVPTIAAIATDLSSVNRPSFGSVKDVTIDVNGYVHFATYIHGAFSDNVDSLGYFNVYNLWNGFVCDIHQTATGWDAFIIDTVWTKDVDDANSPTTDPLTWDERMQMSRTTDGSKIFYAWMDTDTLLGEYNLYPDIYVKIYDVATSTLGPKVNVTKGGDYDANNYWMYFSDITFDMGTYYQLHVSTTDLNLSDIAPVNHRYINGLYLNSAGNLVESVNELPLDAFVSLYPNPTSGELNIAFNDNASGNYNLVVYNTIGSVVLNDNIDVTGAVVRTISLEKLPAGIYMVEVSNDNGKTSKKVIKN